MCCACIRVLFVFLHAVLKVELYMFIYIQEKSIINFSDVSTMILVNRCRARIIRKFILN